LGWCPSPCPGSPRWAPALPAWGGRSGRGLRPSPFAAPAETWGWSSLQPGCDGILRGPLAARPPQSWPRRETFLDASAGAHAVTSSLGPADTLDSLIPGTPVRECPAPSPAAESARADGGFRLSRNEAIPRARPPETRHPALMRSWVRLDSLSLRAILPTPAPARRASAFRAHRRAGTSASPASWPEGVVHP